MQSINVNTVLQMAAFHGHHEIAEFLILQGAEINTGGIAWCSTTALHFALEMKNLDIARLLINNGADVNAPPSSCCSSINTCLQLVALHRNLDWVKV